ncbi:MAG: zinc/iron-chelating domain-containing protein [Desulfuromonas sp.]|nr:MAG: zinc/iron-chelating domain-containing protein [Desulfuromonas sp.]
MNDLPADQVKLLHSYRNLLQEIDTWFNRCQSSYPGQITCHKSCSGCCRGLFDITLLDAALIQQGTAQLPEHLRSEIITRCHARVRELQKCWPTFSSPWILNRLPADQWQQMPEDDPTPCALLSATGTCEIYPYRPMICRLHGLPNIDLSGEDFSSELCTLNFKGSNPRTLHGLRWRFHQIFEAEIGLFEDFTRQLSGHSLRELDTFIPCAPLIDFKRGDWGTVLADYDAE